MDIDCSDKILFIAGSDDHEYLSKGRGYITALQIQEKGVSFIASMQISETIVSRVRTSKWPNFLVLAGFTSIFIMSFDRKNGFKEIRKFADLHGGINIITDLAVKENGILSCSPGDNAIFYNEIDLKSLGLS